MSTLVLHIERDFSKFRNLPGVSYFFGDSLEKALNDRCKVTLEVDDKIYGEATETNWGTLNPKDLLTFLESYRHEPGNTEPQQNIREALHNFLFAKRVFDGPIAAELARASSAQESAEILIRGDSSSLPLIVNIPWELAEAVLTTPGSVQALAGTMAAVSVARVIKGTNAQLTSVKERLRVLYCISQPRALQKIGAPSFHRSLEDVLAARSAMLSYQAVIDNNFTPRFNQLMAGIAQTQPHVLIIVCHGKTMNGIPHLHFEKWQPVTDLADALAQSARTFLVILVACDQTRLDEHPSAHSGAVTFLQNGILSVVAMQSSVSASLAKKFLGTALDWFFKTGELALSVAEGRKSMAPTKANAERIVDWSFPALFLSDDAPKHTGKLARIIEAYLPTLDEMLRRIPRPEPYLPRPEFDQPLAELMRVGVAGLREITGAPLTGKTAIVQNACRRALERAIEFNDTTARKVLYVDFSRYSEIANTAPELMGILRKQTEEIHSTAAGTPLLTWPVPRGADGDPGMRDSIGQLAASIDANEMVLVLDNLEVNNDPFWSEFLERVRSLNHSLVIRVRESSDDNAGDLEVLAFTQEQTETYVKSFAPKHVAATANWFTATAGLPGQLELLRKADGDYDVVNVSASLFTRSVSELEKNILYTLTNLPNGVDAQLADTFLDADLDDLTEKGLVFTESRFGITSSWFRLPTLLKRALEEDSEKTTHAAISLVDTFADRIAPEDGPSTTEVLVKLASKPGGVDFLQDIHQVFIDHGYDEMAHTLPLLLHKSLFGKGRWYEAFKFWERLLTRTEFEQSEAQEWLKLAKAAHVLGFGQRAWECIENAKERGLTLLDQIDLLILKAAVIKDSGHTKRAAEVTEIYDQVLLLISNAKLDPAQLAAAEINQSDLAERYALAIYNRAIHKSHWLRDGVGAVADLDQAAKAFGELDDVRMKALADCEWSEVQLDSPQQNQDWNKMLERLFSANRDFVSVGAAGDSAFCNYQIARYFRRKPFSTLEESTLNSRRAREAYEEAARQAQLAGDSRQKAIAEGHIVEVRWLDQAEIGAAAAAERLENVITVLKTYQGDAWSTRVMRDMLQLRAQALQELKSNDVLVVYSAAWETAIQPPLHAAYGVDARRAASMLAEYLDELEKNNRTLEADGVSVNAKDYIQQWLNHVIDPLTRKGWIEEVRQYGAGHGGDYGQSKR